MRLIPVDRVRTRMMLPDLPGLLNTIQEVLEGVTEALESELRTSFGLVRGAQDVFYFEDSSLFGGRFSAEMILRRGLVRENETDVSVVTAPTKLDLLQEDVIDLRSPTETSFVDDKDQHFDLDAERGIVVVSDYRLLRDYVRVTYDAGIETDRLDSGLFLQAAPSMRGSPDLTFSDDNPDTVTRSAGSWVNDGFKAGDRVAFTGATNAANNATFTVSALTDTVLTVLATEALVAEGPTSGMTAVVTSTPSVPGWLKELATAQALLDLTASKVLGVQPGRAETGDRLRPEFLERRLARLLDEHTRYRPSAARPVGPDL